MQKKEKKRREIRRNKRTKKRKSEGEMMLLQKLSVLSNTIDTVFGSSQLRNIIPLSIVSLSKTDQWKDTFSPEFSMYWHRKETIANVNIFQCCTFDIHLDIEIYREHDVNIISWIKDWHNPPRLLTELTVWINTVEWLKTFVWFYDSCGCQWRCVNTFWWALSINFPPAL